MIIYADVLIFVNIIVNYFLLLLTAKLNKITYKFKRIIFSAVVGGVFSLYIFLPQLNFTIDLIIKLLFAVCMVLTAFGYKRMKVFFRNLCGLILSTFLYAGTMYGLWQVSKSNVIFINNSVVYFDISITYIIIFSIIFYLAFTVINYFTKKQAIKAKKASFLITIDEKTKKGTAIFDTGNSVVDLFSDSIVVIVEKNFLTGLLGKNFSFKEEPYLSRYRILPCKTISDTGIIEGIRCDTFEFINDGKRYSYKNPVVLLSKTSFVDDFDAILNPEILLNIEV